MVLIKTKTCFVVLDTCMPTVTYMTLIDLEKRSKQEKYDS